MKEKNFLLMSSTKGIGFGIARELVKKNYNIFIGSRNQENVQKAIDELISINQGKVFGNILDVNSFDSIQKWFEKALEIFQSFDGVLINYGGPPTGKFLDFDDKIWQSTFEYMLLNPIRFLKLVYPYLKENSSILFITSYSVKEPVDNLILSNVFRSGITALMKNLTKEWGPKIRLNCLMPGRIDTERIRQIDSILAEKEGKSVDEIRKNFESQIPLKKYGTIEEIGKIGAFLLSEDSFYINGSSIAVDGGLIRSLF